MNTIARQYNKFPRHCMPLTPLRCPIPNLHIGCCGGPVYYKLLSVLHFYVPKQAEDTMPTKKEWYDHWTRYTIVTLLTFPLPTAWMWSPLLYQAGDRGGYTKDMQASQLVHYLIAWTRGTNPIHRHRKRERGNFHDAMHRDVNIWKKCVPLLILFQIPILWPCEGWKLDTQSRRGST